MLKKKFTKSSWKKVVAAAVATAFTTGSGYFVLTHKNNSLTVPAYTVAHVMDGDTFETTENQIVRFFNVYAPELKYCGGPEAKTELEKLVLGKPVYFKVMYKDKYKRLDSLVYTDEGSVNLKMVERGFARYSLDDTTSTESLELQKASLKARELKLGIYSDKCSQDTNTSNPKCNIKANIGEYNKYYHYPGCKYYNNTKVQLYLGDRWFCTRKEAEKAGFTKATFCPD